MTEIESAEYINATAERRHRVWRMREEQRMQFTQIAVELGVSAPRARQIYEDAAREMRHSRSFFRRRAMRPEDV